MTQAENTETSNMNDNGLVVAVDACRNKSGGARIHLRGIFDGLDPQAYGISEIHLWVHKGLADKIPDQPWLVKHIPPALDKSIFHQLWWQAFHLTSEIEAAGCKICLSTTASSSSRFSPVIAISRDMVSFEAGEMERYPLWSRQRWRVFALKYIQIRSLRNADAVVFLTIYASSVIQTFTGKLSQVRIIHHGIGDNFRGVAKTPEKSLANKEVKCIYVSETHLYKHQWHVVDAIDQLRAKGFSIQLTLVGDVSNEGGVKLKRALREHDPNGEFVTLTGPLTHEKLIPYLKETDIYIFASSCENMPNTLVEGMAAGLPIACAKRGPMPDVLEDTGLYFDPEKPETIASSVQRLIEDDDLRHELSKAAYDRAMQFSWERCARETWSYIRDVAKQHSGKSTD